VRITDCQIHEIGPYWDWLAENTELQHKVLSEMMVAYLDALGVERVILFAGHEFESAAWMAEKLPKRIAFVPQINADEPEIDAAIRAAKARHSQGQLGVRVLISWPMDGSEARRLEAGGWDPVFAACERHRVPVFTLITGWLSRAEEIARRYPDLTLVIDHVGLPQPPADEPDDPPFAKLPELLALARLPNVYVKLCGLPSLSKETYPFNDVAPQLRKIVDAFGAERLMWGSDTSRFVGRTGIHRFQFPKTLGQYLGKHTYAESLFFIRESTVLTQAQKEAILGGTLQRVLNWPY
jgi:L-fuconolactonase